MIQSYDRQARQSFDFTPQLAEIQEAICFAFIPPPITGLGNAGGFEYQLLDIGEVGVASWN